jgi:hypothetical protein
MKTIVFEKLTVIDVKKSLDSVDTFPVTTEAALATEPHIQCIQHTTDMFACE